MKKKVYVISVIVLFIFGISGCFTKKEKNKEEVKEIIKIKLNTTNSALEIGDKLNLIPTVEPLGAKTDNIVWRSSDNNIATVENGIVKGISSGNALITVTNQSGMVKAECAVVVYAYYEGEHPLYRNTDLNYIFDLDNVAMITITISEAEWNKLLANYDINPINDEEVQADFKFERNGKAEEVKNIGFRLKGNTTRTRPEKKYTSSLVHGRTAPVWQYSSFSIKFDKFEKKQEFYDLNGINLKTMRKNKSLRNETIMINEPYSYDLMRRFNVWSAPRAGFAGLTIKIKEDEKPAYFGIYETVEPVDKKFLKKRIADDYDGNLWKCLCTDTGEANFFYEDLESKIGISDENINLKYTYDLKTNKKEFDSAKSELSEYIKELCSSEEGTWCHTNFNEDLFIRYMAVNLITYNFDSYPILCNNFYFYINSHNNGTFIPYDLDNSLGGSKGSIINFLSIAGKRPLCEKVMYGTENWNKYINYVKKIVTDDNYFAADGSIDRIKRWYALLKPYIKDDINAGADDIDVLEQNRFGIKYIDGNDSGGENSNVFKSRVKFIKNELETNKLNIK